MEISCAVCDSRSPKIFICSCRQKVYCSKTCQLLDYARHKTVCSVKLRDNFNGRKLTPVEEKLIAEFWHLKSGREDSIRYFTKSIHFLTGTNIVSWAPENERKKLTFHTEQMQPILHFITHSQIIPFLDSILTTSQLRTSLLSPFLWSTIEWELLRKNHVYLGIPDAFTQLLLFPNSRRPLADMRNFWQWYEVPSVYRDAPDTNWHVLRHKQEATSWFLLDETPGIFRDEKYSVPILRYQEGMHRGLFHGQTAQKFCGTFFYYEPESPAHLLCGDILIAVNKIHALKLLKIPFSEVMDIFSDAQWLEIRFGQTKFPEEIHGGHRMNIPEHIVVSLLKLPPPTQEMNFFKLQNTLFPRALSVLYEAAYDADVFLPSLYAMEDIFDQLLCTTAEKQHIDCILLTRMTGGRRVISEALDTRNRQAVFANMWIKE